MEFNNNNLRFICIFCNNCFTHRMYLDVHKQKCSENKQQLILEFIKSRESKDNYFVKKINIEHFL
jgi:hypothetical protein